MPNIHHSKNIVLGSITAGGDVIVGDTTYVNNYFAGEEVKIPHRLTNYIPTNAEYILGRDTELETISKYLKAKKPTVLVNGIGGIGKTSVAIKYMAIHGEEYKHLAWITVQSSILETFISNSALLESLQITEKVQDLIKAKQLDNAFELVFHQLNILEKTLVVLDNANDLEDLEKYEHLFDTASCHFLITSRTYPPEWTTIAIDSLPEEEALRLFKKLHPSVQASDEAIKSLLSKLFYHTLLIELVAKSIESSAYVFEELQEIIETQFIHHESLNQDIVSTGKHGAVIKDNLKKSKIEDYIWLIFSKIKGLDERSRNILMSMALLPLAFMIERNDLRKHLSVFDLKEPMPALVVLVERGWVDRIKSLEQKTFFKMHPLIADVVIKHLNVDVIFADQYILYIKEKIDYDETNSAHNLIDKKYYEIFSERLTNLYFNQDSGTMAVLLNILTWYYKQFGDYDKAIKLGEKALKMAQNVFHSNDDRISQCENNLALVYRDKGLYNEAVVLLENALKNRKRKININQSSIATRFSNLAMMYQNLGQYDKSIVFYKKALNIDKKNFGINHPTIAIRHANLATVYFQLGRYSDAAMLAEKALNSDIKNFGNEDPNVAIRQSNLARIYRSLGRYKEALVLAESALNSDEKNFGSENPTLAFSQNNLALIYQDLGREIEAQDLWLKAYQIRLKKLGDVHPLTIDIKEKLTKI